MKMAAAAGYGGDVRDRTKESIAQDFGDGNDSVLPIANPESVHRKDALDRSRKFAWSSSPLAAVLILLGPPPTAPSGP